MKFINVISEGINQCPHVRFRAAAEYNLPRLDKAGIRFQFNPKEIDEEEAVVFQRPTSDETLEMCREAYSRWKAPVLIDLDDPIYREEVMKGTKYENAFKETYKGMIDVLKNHCDGIVVSTEALGKDLEKITNKPIVIMPNAVNPHYTPKKHTKTILYAGAGERAGDFSQEWRDSIKAMQKKGYKFISTTNIGLEDERFAYVPAVDFHNAIRYIAPEYYISPLADNLLNRCKSDLKELEAWMLGVKFLGGINSVPDFKKAKVPTFDKTRDYTTPEYLRNFIGAYSGMWLGGN